MSLLDLSLELIAHILSYLHYVDLNACRRVNRGFNNLIRGNVQLQYSMQLQLSGYEDNADSPLVVAEKYKMLKQQEFSWSCLDFEKETSLRIPFTPSSIYDLTDGVLLLGECSPGMQYGADNIRWTQLNKLISQDPPYDCWEKIDVGAHIIDVGLAVQEHDLIVVATDREAEDGQTVFELRLIQLSTGLPHPLASKPIIPLATVPSLPHLVVGQCSVCLEIIGDLLCFMFHHPSGSAPPSLTAIFEVHNWKTGNRLQIRKVNCCNYSTFTFLAPDIVALPNCADHSIELCRIGNVLDDSMAPSDIETVSILRLPRLGKEHSIVQITCRSEPKMTNASRDAPGFRSTEPFHLNPENAIVIFNIMTHDSHGFHECLTLIVHTAALLSVLSDSLRTAADDSLPASSPSALVPECHGTGALPLEGVPETIDDTHRAGPASPRRIPWARWGPRACRFLETSFSASRWITTTCGQRYVTVDEDPMEDNSTRSNIVVYDFNPHTVRRLATLHRRKRRRQLRGHWEVTLPEGEVVAGSAAVDNFLSWSRSDDAALIPFTDPHTKVIGQIQCEPTELMAGYALEYRIFDEPVRTSLPYAQMSSFETYAYGAVLLDRNVIIGVKLNQEDDIQELVIHSIRTGRPETVDGGVQKYVV